MGKLIIINNGNNIDLSKVNITSSDILSGKIGIDNKGNIINGNIPIQGGSTIIPKTTNQTIVSSGKYINGNIIVQGDSDLIAANIKKGVNIFGVTGTCKELITKTGSGTTSNYGSRYSLKDSAGTPRYFYQVNLGNLGITPVFLTIFTSHSGTYYPPNINGLNGSFNSIDETIDGYYPPSSQGTNSSKFSASGSNFIAALCTKDNFWWGAVGFK